MPRPVLSKAFEEWFEENKNIPWADSEIVEEAFKAGWEARDLADDMEVEREARTNES